MVDADVISRGLTAAGGAAIPFIRENFGDEYILPDGSLDRPKMRELVFNDPAMKELLESGTTAVVVNELAAAMESCEQAGEAVAFASIPLLFESGMEAAFDESWLVTADMDVRIRRLRERDGLTDEMIYKIIANQMPEEEKLARATRIIDNSGSLDELYQALDDELARLTSEIIEKNSCNSNFVEI